MEKWECTAEYEKTCPLFTPFPPRMTEKGFNEAQDFILSGVPKEFHSAFSQMAYERGHSSGYEEVIICLRELVGDLKEPIATFQKRIRSEKS
jgi:hypothetical protein